MAWRSLKYVDARGREFEQQFFSQSSHKRENRMNFRCFPKEFGTGSPNVILDFRMRARQLRHSGYCLGDLLSHILIETPGNRLVLAVPGYGSYLRLSHSGLANPTTRFWTRAPRAQW